MTTISEWRARLGIGPKPHPGPPTIPSDEARIARLEAELAVERATRITQADTIDRLVTLNEQLRARLGEVQRELRKVSRGLQPDVVTDTDLLGLQGRPPVPPR